MDEHLIWKFHITELRKKNSKTVGIFLKVRHYASPLLSLSIIHCSSHSLNVVF